MSKAELTLTSRPNKDGEFELAVMTSGGQKVPVSKINYWEKTAQYKKIESSIEEHSLIGGDEVRP